MSRHPTRAQFFLAFLLVVAPVAEAQVGVYVTVTSDYIYRGLMMTDDNPALQLGLDYRHDSGWFGGAWASTIDLRTPGGKRDLEIDYYAGFNFQPLSSWAIALALMRYTYPGASGDHAYDHGELLASATWNDRWSLELAYTDDLYGLGATGRHWEVHGEQPLGESWLVGGALGGNDLSDLGTSHFLHWDLGASFLYSRFSVDFRYFDNQRPDGGLAGTLAAGSQFVVSVTATF